MKKMAIHSLVGLVIMTLSFLLGTKARPFIPLPSLHNELTSNKSDSFYSNDRSQSSPTAAENYATSIPFLEKVRTNDVSETILNELKTRFAKKYSDIKAKDHHNDPEESELVIRLSLLQALAKNAPDNSQSENEKLFPLYRDILINPYENWIVKSQVLKNTADYLPQLSLQEREMILSKVDVRARSLWKISDRQLAEALVSHAQ